MAGTSKNTEASEAQPGTFFLFALAIGAFLALLAAGLLAGEFAEVQRNGATL